jgi:uncharacterized membrane protein AbrB (regulator of aidB expression)
MDPNVAIGFFATTIACIAAITWLVGVKSKITGPVLLTGIFVVVAIMTLATWKQPMPEGILPVLAGVIGYAFGIVTKKEP